jgi:hypothetical protein
MTTSATAEHTLTKKRDDDHDNVKPRFPSNSISSLSLHNLTTPHVWIGINPTAHRSALWGK